MRTAWPRATSLPTGIRPQCLERLEVSGEPSAGRDVRAADPDSMIRPGRRRRRDRAVLLSLLTFVRRGRRRSRASTRSSPTCSSATARGSASGSTTSSASGSATGRRSRSFKDLGQLAAEAGDRRRPQPIRQRFEAMVEQSGLDLTPGRLLAIAAVAGWSWGRSAACSARARWSALVAAPVGAAVPLCLRPGSAEGAVEKLLLAAPRRLRPDGPGRPRRPDHVPGAAGGRRRVPAADRRRVRLLLRAAEPRPLARGRLPRPGPAHRPDGDQDLRPGPPGPAADRRQPRRAARQALGRHPRAVPDPGPDQDPDGRGPDAGGRPAWPCPWSCSCIMLFFNREYATILLRAPQA